MQQGGAISGTVTNTGEAPIEALQVCIAVAENTVGQCAQTNPSGQYTVRRPARRPIQDPVHNNSCNFEGCKQLNYIQQYYNGKSNFGAADSVVVVAGGRRTKWTPS